MKTSKLLSTILATMCGGVLCVHAQSFLTNGLVAFYPFNGSANDASGNGNNGSIVGNDWKYSLDRFGQPNCLYLNTTSTPSWDLDGAYVSVPRSPALDFNNDFALSVWVNLPSAVTTQLPENLVSNGEDSDSVNLRIVVNHAGFGGNDYLQFCAGIIPNGCTFALSSPLRQMWWQFSVTRSGTNLTLYKNGSFLTNLTMSAAVPNNPSIWFGRHFGWAFYPLVGGIDDVRIYNRALSAPEVRELYEYESGPRVNLIKALKPAFDNLTVSTNYQLQVSADMDSWTNHGSPFTATNTSMVFPQYWDVDNWGKLFFRVQVAP